MPRAASWQVTCRDLRMASHFRWLVLGGCVGSLLTAGVMSDVAAIMGLGGGGQVGGRASPSPRTVPGSPAPASPVPATQLPLNARVIADATVWVTPPQSGATCVVLAPGALTALVHLARQGPEALVTFSFAGDEPADPAASIRIDVAVDPRGWTVPLAGGRYCYRLNNWGPVTDNPRGTPVSDLGQDVVLQLAWSAPSPMP